MKNFKGIVLTSFSWQVRSKYVILVLIVALSSLLFVNIVKAQDRASYLKSLDGEAATLSLDSKTTNVKRKSTQSFINKNIGIGSEQGGAISELVPGLSVEQFEKILKSNYIGSYLFYKRLSQSKKGEVYVFYQSNPDSAKVREKILQVSKKNG